MQLQRRSLLGLSLVIMPSGAWATMEAQPLRNAVTRSYAYDLVRLFPGGAHNPNDGMEVYCGGSNYNVVIGNAIYHFSSRETQEVFAKDPQHFLPGCGGRCLLGWYRRATGKPHQGVLPPVGDPRARTFGAGRWHFHGGKGAEKEFEKDPGTIEERTINTVAWIRRTYGARYDQGTIG